MRTEANPDVLRTGKRFVLSSVSASVVAVAGLAIAGCAASRLQPAIPKIEENATWRLSEGCRVYRLGIPTAPDCDVLTGRGIAIQITRIRLLSLQPGQDDRSTIGIEFHPDHDSWSFSAPYASLLIAGGSYTPADLDEAIVFAKGGAAILERLQPHRERYLLPPGERRFLRLRFSVPQNKLGNGFALQITGLQREGEAVRVPLLEFETQ
jgi:hypothetical protein